MENYSFKTLSLNLALALAAGMVLIFLNQKFLYNDALLYQEFAEELAPGQITLMTGAISQFQSLGYLLFVVVNIIKYSVVTLIIQAGVYISGHRTSFFAIVKVVIISESILLLSTLVKFCWFYFINQDFTYSELNSFSPLSLVSMFDADTVSYLWFYPLQTINLFELGYMLTLAMGVRTVLGIDYNSALQIILSTYLPALLVWIVLVMFLVVSLDPSI